jgi:alpha-1,3-glucosyltransferase
MLQVTWKAAGLTWVGAVALKICMVAAYRSTDFEVHRNWFAITASLPLSRWYYEETSQWTLDYPPLFAWFQRGLGLLAPLFDQKLLIISADPYESAATILFQRLTVIGTEVMLLIAALSFARSHEESAKGSSSGAAVAILLALNAGIFITDHVHFQYNGFLLGVLMLSAIKINNGQHLTGALLFCILLNMKHLFLALGPAYFVYLLRFHCLHPHKTCWNTHCAISGFAARFSVLGVLVIGIFAITWAPFFLAGGLPALQQIFKRLFPFGRGLCHAYWAPNVWVLYNVVDMVMVKALGSRGRVTSTSASASSMTAGLVQDSRHVWLPHISPLSCAVLSLCAMMPGLVHVWRHAAPSSPHPRTNTTTDKSTLPHVSSRLATNSSAQRPCMMHLIGLCSLAAFLFGYHVHEKALLHAAIPLLFVARRSQDHAELYRFLSNVTHCQLLPLLFRREEWVLKMLLWWLDASLARLFLPPPPPPPSTALQTRLLYNLKYLYQIGLVVLPEVVEVMVAVLLPRLSFLPLLFRSAYCLPGVIYSFVETLRLFLLTPPTPETDMSIHTCKG